MIRGIFYTKCNKLGYKDVLGAKLALAELQARPSGRRMEIRYYHCRRCRTFHVTRQEKR